MNETSQVELAKGDRNTSQIKDGKSHHHQNLKERSSAQQPSDQTGVSEMGSTRNACESKSTSSRTSSRRGKLSLRRDAGRQGNSKRQIAQAGPQSKAPTEVMKAILGETTLNQSSDFKEPLISRGSVQGLGGRRRACSSLSRTKGNKSRNTVATSDSSIGPNPIDQGEEASECDKMSSKVKQKAQVLSCCVDTKITAAAAQNAIIAKTSSVKVCSVYVSKLNLPAGSFPPSKSPAAISHEVHRATQLTPQSDLPQADTNVASCSGKELKRPSIPRKGDVESQTNPPLPVPGAALDQDADNHRQCPMCEETVPGGDATLNMRNHVQKCLRQRFTNFVKARDVTGNSDDTSGDEEFARLLQRREEEKLQEEMLMDSEKFFCQICQRELSHMNTTRRAQHINRCIDSNEAAGPQPRQVTTQSQRARGAVHVPDCPICGKHFKTKKQRESHLKKCARQHHVSPQQLIALVRVQEEVAPQGEGALGGAIEDSRGAIGMTGAGVSVGVGTSAGVGTFTGVGTSAGADYDIGAGGSPTDSAGVKGRTDGQPGGTGAVMTRDGDGTSEGATAGVKSKGAIDSMASTGESEGITLGPADTAGPSGAMVSREQVLLNVPSRGRGGRNTTRGRSTTRRKGRRKLQTPVETVEVPLLMRRTEEEHKRVLGARMADIILQQGNAVIRKTPSMNRSKVAARFKPLHVSPRQSRTSMHSAEAAAVATQQVHSDGKRTTLPTKPSPSEGLMILQSVPLWSLASASDSSSQTPFYVHRLLPVITPQKGTSSRLVNASLRCTTPRNLSQGEPNLQKSVVPGDAPQPTTTSSISQEGPATQALGRTIQILADLAAESAPPPCTLSSDNNLTTASGFIPAEEAGKEDDNQEYERDEVEEESMIAVNHHQLEILQSLSGLVNSEELSDLHLVTSDGSIIYAHQFMMMLRCPSLAQLIEVSPSCSSSKAKKRLDLQDFSRGAVLCVLDFIYAGKVAVTGSGAEEVGKLAKRFLLSKLSDFCRQLCNQDNKSSTVSDPKEQTQGADPFLGSQLGRKEGLGPDVNEFFPDKGLDELIQSLWDSSDDEGDKSHKGDEDDAMDEDDAKSEDDSNKKAPTLQMKRRFPHQVSDTESDAESKDSAPDDEELEEIYEFFSTQRQQSSNRSNNMKSDDQNEDTGNVDSDGDIADDEEDNNDDDKKENSIKVKANCRRRSFTILEQLQSSCQPQSQKSLLNEEPAPSPEDAASTNLCGYGTPERKSKRRKCSESSTDDLINSSSDVITPCFVHVKRLSNDLPVSPLKEKWSAPTVGTCLESQCNLTPALTEKRKKKVGKEEKEPGRTEQFEDDNMEVDVTLADVSNSIFQSGAESDADVGLMDISQSWKSDEQNKDKLWETDQASNVQQPTRTVMRGGEQNEIWSEDSLFGSSYHEKDDSRAEEVDSSTKVTSVHRGIPGCSGTEDESLPFVDIRSQPNKQQILECSGDNIPSNQHERSEEPIGSDEGPRLIVSEEMTGGSQETNDDAVIDLSQDDEHEVEELVASGAGKDVHEDDGTGESKETAEDGVEDVSTDEDVSWIVAQTPASVSSRIKIVSNPSRAHHSAKISSPVKPSIIKPQRFTFRRRDRQADTEETLARTCTTHFNMLGTSAIYNTENKKPKSSNTFTSIIETPDALRAATNMIKDSSTPRLGQNYGTASHHHGYISPKVSPVKENGYDDDDQKKVEKISGMSQNEKMSCPKEPREIASSDSSRKQHNITSVQGTRNDGSPVLKCKKNHTKRIDELVSVGQSRDKSLLLSPRSKLTVRLEEGSEQEDSGPDSPCLSGTLLRPTPDCFDADTPELIRSIPPQPLSPSPPPSPRFGSMLGLKPKDAAFTSTVHQSVDDACVHEKRTSKESLAMRCKRKLQNEGEDVEAPSKRSKGQASQSLSHSIIETNLLSPGMTDEDDVIFVQNEDDNEEARTDFKSKRGTSGLDKSVSWPDQLCVGLSPTRNSLESLSGDEEAFEEDVSVVASPESSHDSSTPRIHVDETPPGPEPTTSLKQRSRPMSPVKTTSNSDCHASPKKSSESVSRSQSPIRRRYTGDPIDRIKPQVITSIQKSVSDVQSITSLSPQNVSEDQFAYFGDDGGGYMDDFNFCSNEEMGAGEVAPQWKSQTWKTKALYGDGAVSHVDKPSTTKPTTLKSTLLTSKDCHGNVSITNFSSSDEYASPHGPSSLPASWRDSAGVLSKSALLLRDDAEEFGCSESFLSELKAGNVNEETAWGGVWSTGGGPSNKQSTKTSSQVGRRVAASPVAARSKPMSKEMIDELFHPPAPVTPMPSYDDMNTPLLKNALKKFGVKPLPKKKARLKLKEIYGHTHQVLEDSDSDTDKSGPVTFKLTSAAVKPTSSNPPSKKVASKKAPSKGGKKPTSKQGSRCHRDQEEEATARKPWHLDVEPETGGGSQSGDSKDASDDSEYNKECPEGNDDDDDDDDLQPSQRTSENLQEAIKVYIRTKTDLYERILRYEPLELDELHAQLKNAGIKYAKKKLREFLDCHGITCRVASNNTKRRVRKTKPPKPK